MDGKTVEILMPNPNSAFCTPMQKEEGEPKAPGAPVKKALKERKSGGGKARRNLMAELEAGEEKGK